MATVKADLTGLQAMVTGATNGIGEVTARELARMGAKVVIVGRNTDKARRVTAEIKSVTGNKNVSYMIADLSSLGDVRALAEAYMAQYDHLHILVNNAGAFFNDFQKTVDGYEKTFALNHLNYFLLTNLLLPILKASGTPQRKARIVNVSSNAHYQPRALNFDNLQGEKNFSGFTAYSASKLENVMFTYELARRLEAENANVTANVLHPGFVASGFGKNNGGLVKMAMSFLHLFAIDNDKGAETSVYLAASPQVEGVTGKYFEKSAEKRSSDASYNVEAQKRLWELSEELTGLREAATTDA